MIVIGAATATTYAGFTACRTLQGFFNTAPQVIGLSIIHDMFDLEERASKVNIWACSFVAGPYIGPFLSGLLIERLSWRATYGILAGLHGFAITVIVFCGEETLYNRDSDQHNRSKALRLIGHPTGHANRPGAWKSFRHTFQIAILPQLMLPTLAFTLINFMWAIGIVTTVTQFVKAPPYVFSDLSVALIYLAPLTGTVLAELWGSYCNEFLQQRFVLDKGKFRPENRLWAIIPAVVFGISGLVLYGQTLQHSLHWTGLAFGWGFITFGVLAATTVIEAYVLDCFPGHAAAASSWVNFWRTTGKAFPQHSVSIHPWAN